MTTEAPPTLGFERVPDTFGGYRWDGDRRVHQFTPREAKRIVRALITASKEEAYYREAKLVREGVAPKTASALVHNSLCAPGAHRSTFRTGDFDTKDSAKPNFVEHGVLWVYPTGEVAWAAHPDNFRLGRRHPDPMQEVNSMLSGSWMGRVLYEHIAAVEVRSAK